MSRYLNIVVVRQGDSSAGLAVEDALRLMGRVLAVGRRVAGRRDVDIPCGEAPDLSALERQLPPALRPDLVVLADVSAGAPPAGLAALSCPVLACLPEGAAPAGDAAALAPCRHILCAGEETALRLRGAGLGRAAHVPYALPGGGASRDVLLAVMQACFAGAALPAAAAARQVAAAEAARLAGVATPGERSFVIAVLDESPAGPHGIATLLDDLRSVPGEVICVFNEPGIGEKYRRHPRVDRYALLSHNTGVGRAWNIGLLMSTAPCVCVLNADLRLGPAGVDRLQRALFAHAGVAVAGPSGGFTDFAAAKDLHYLAGQDVAPVTLVDQVSGYYFAVRRDLLAQAGIAFHPEYLPCYMEEWDLALQARDRGLACLRVRLDDYAHEWGGTTRGREAVQCLGRDHPMSGALEENRRRFLARWAGRFPDPGRVFVPGSGGPN